MPTSRYLSPKSGCEASECEDAVSINEARRWFCVADGATEGFASRYWARLLTKHWAWHRGPVETPEELAAWAKLVGDRFSKRWERRQLSWFAEEKARSGAFAAFAAIWFSESGSQLHWKAVAIGDACVIVRRPREAIQSFPLDDPKKFGFRPFLLSSNRNAQNTMIEKAEFRAAEALPGDTFFLLTDAIAAWFLHVAKSVPEEILRFEELLGQELHAELDEFIERARSNGSLRNDDVGVLRIRVAP
jgi:hypothetical protein